MTTRRPTSLLRAALLCAAGFAGALVGLPILSAAPAVAQEFPACERFAWSVQRELAAFAEPGLPVLAPGASLPAGTMAVSLRLRPAAEANFPVPPERAPKPDTFGGFVTAPAVPGGVYQVTVSGEAWIDVSQGGRTSLKSLGQSGQKGCPSVRKSLRFRLEPGPVTIQLSGAPVDQVAVGLFRAD